MRSGRKILLTVLFVVFIFKIVVWLLLSFDVFARVASPDFWVFFTSVFTGLSRAFILVIPFLVLIDLFLDAAKKLYVVFSVGYFVLYGLSILTDYQLRASFPEITGDILETLAFVLFLVPVLIEFIKTWKGQNEKRIVTFHFARLGWAAFLTMFGLADLLSGNRLALRTFADYTLVFCAITFITQFLLDKEKI